MATRHSGTSGDPVNAGFWRRCAARLMDSLIVGAISALLTAFLRLAFGANVALSWVGDLEGFAIGWLYVTLQESSTAQATLGKRLMGLKVTDEHGERIGFGRATFRFFAQILSVAIACVGFMMAGWTARKQALHDILAGTLVVFRDANSGARHHAAMRPPMPWYGWAINLAGIGLLAWFCVAIAVMRSTYRELAVRSDFIDGLREGEYAQQAINDFYIDHKRCPATSVEAGFEQTDKESGKITRVTIEPACRIVVEFDDTEAVKAPLRGQRIDMTMDGAPDESGLPAWRCASTVSADYRPALCKD
jgi:uncharacterized RDD family membrane protein YckC